MTTTEIIYSASTKGMRGTVRVSAYPITREHRDGMIIDSFGAGCTFTQERTQAHLNIKEAGAWCAALAEETGTPVEYKQYDASGNRKATFRYGFTN